MCKKMTVVALLMTMVFFASVGCRRSGTTTSGGDKKPSAPPKGATQPPPTAGNPQAPAERTPPARSSQPPTAGGEANQPTTQGVTEVSTDVSARKQTQTYMQDAEKTITDLHQEMNTLQTQVNALKEEAKPKAVQLQKQFQDDLANAQAALARTKTVSGAAWTEAREAADKAMSSAASTLTQLQSYLQSQQGTK